MLGRHDEAVASFEAAVATNRHTGARPAETIARVGLAQALAARSGEEDLGRAEAQAQTALRACGRLGMPGPAHTAGVLLDSIRASRRAADPLTPREREVAALVAQAHTNAEIARRLVLSERTVETHVRSILAKLGAANRTDLARRVH